MALEALSPNELLNILMYDTIFATPCGCNESSDTSFIPETSFRTQEFGGGSVSSSPPMEPRCSVGLKAVDRLQKPVVQGRRKRRKQKFCKNKEEAETQRMTHIAVERNRRKQMNEHLAVLRSLMPKSYVQRGDQASIVGGAIEYVKELEHLLQSLEAQKLLLLQGGMLPPDTATAATATTPEYLSTPSLQFFKYPPSTGSKISNNYISKSKAVVVDTEVTLIETHANLRILSTKSFRQVSKMVTGFQTLYLTILHLNVTTLDPVVLYSISAKVEEGCPLKSADDIAGAVHHMLTIIEEESKLC